MSSKEKNIGLKTGRPSIGTSQKMISDVIAEVNKNIKMIRISVDISEEMHLNLKYYAMVNKKTLAKVLQDYISDLPKAPIPKID
jgi:metal-dependent amidase/aminoacylase/carboxypeptidase family protein